MFAKVEKLRFAIVIIRPCRVAIFLSWWTTEWRVSRRRGRHFDGETLMAPRPIQPADDKVTSLSLFLFPRGRDQYDGVGG